MDLTSNQPFSSLSISLNASPTLQLISFFLQDLNSYLAINMILNFSYLLNLECEFVNDNDSNLMLLSLVLSWKLFDLMESFKLTFDVFFFNDSILLNIVYYIYLQTSFLLKKDGDNKQ